MEGGQVRMEVSLHGLLTLRQLGVSTSRLNLLTLHIASVSFNCMFPRSALGIPDHILFSCIIFA